MTQRKLIIVGNPPYQMKDGGHNASAVPLYDKFITTCIDHLQPDKVCMIVPSRWMAGGRGLDTFRERMAKDRRIKMIRHFGQEESDKVFKSVRISGGVNYFLWDSQYNGDCDFNGVPYRLDQFDVILRNVKHIPVVQKVMAVHKGRFMNDVVSPSRPFGVRADHKNWVTSLHPSAVKCYVRGMGTAYIPESAITQKSWNIYKNSYKVCVPGARNEGSEVPVLPWRVLGTPFVAEPMTACVETYLVAHAFPTQVEADNFIEYMKTRFFRYMIFIRSISQHLTRDVYTWVPDMGNYNKIWTDADLIAHFGLTDDEVENMNATIRAW